MENELDDILYLLFLIRTTSGYMWTYLHKEIMEAKACDCYITVVMATQSMTRLYDRGHGHTARTVI